MFFAAVVSIMTGASLAAPVARVSLTAASTALREFIVTLTSLLDPGSFPWIMTISN
jgi:hypothetical protein